MYSLVAEKFTVCSSLSTLKINQARRVVLFNTQLMAHLKYFLKKVSKLSEILYVLIIKKFKENDSLVDLGNRATARGLRIHERNHNVARAFGGE